MLYWQYPPSLLQSVGPAGGTRRIAEHCGGFGIG